MLSRHSYKRLENDVDPLAVVTHGGGRDRGGKGSRVGDLWRRLRGARDGGGVGGIDFFRVVAGLDRISSGIEVVSRRDVIPDPGTNYSRGNGVKGIQQ